MVMSADPGEYIAGCYLKKVMGCDFVDYNVRSPGGGLKGLGELDVVGLDFKINKAYICEVATHIRGINYGGNQETVARILRKHERQQEYAREYLKCFPNVEFMFWSPVVPKGYITTELTKTPTLTLVINEEYKRCIDALKKLAVAETHDSGNIFFRYLQILESVGANS
jgi:hypothetical protein